MEQAKNFFDYPHSPFRDESDFAGLFSYACGILDMSQIKQEGIYIVRRAFAHGGIADEHQPIFALTVELKLGEFKRLGELPQWLQRLEHHTECLVELVEGDTRVTPEGLRYWFVPGATPPVPPTQVTFLEPPSGESRRVIRQVVRLSRNQVGMEIPRREEETMVPESETRDSVRISELEFKMIKMIWPLFTLDKKVLCKDIQSAARKDGWSDVRVYNAIGALRSKGVLATTDEHGVYSQGVSSVTIGQRGEPEENWRRVVLADLSEENPSSPAAPEAVPNGQMTVQEPEQPPTEAAEVKNEICGHSADLDVEIERLESIKAEANQRCRAEVAEADKCCLATKAEAERQCEEIKLEADKRLEAYRAARQFLATPFPS